MNIRRGQVSGYLFPCTQLPIRPAEMSKSCAYNICLCRRDWFDKPSEDLYGNRVATVLMYLSGAWISFGSAMCGPISGSIRGSTKCGHHHVPLRCAWTWRGNGNIPGRPARRQAWLPHFHPTLPPPSDVEDEAGGETAIPLAVPLDAVQQSTAAMSACAQRGGSYFPGKGIAVRPEKVWV